MKPPDYSRSLYFTPRTPWGRAPQKRPGQGPNYLRASEDAPVQPGQKRPNFLQRVGTGFVKALGSGHLFAGAEGEKNPGEKPSFGAGVGWHMGGGEPSTGEDHKEQIDQFTSAHHGQFTERTTKDRERYGQESAPKKSPDPIDALPAHVKANYYKTLERFRQQQKNKSTSPVQPAAHGL